MESIAFSQIRRGILLLLFLSFANLFSQQTTVFSDDMIEILTNQDSSKIIINKKGDQIFFAHSNSFNITKNDVKSTSSSFIKIFLEDDSLIHASVEFKLDLSNMRMRLNIEEDRGYITPFYSGYHELNFYATLLEWNIYDDNIYIGSSILNDTSIVRFESTANYNHSLFESMQNYDSFHPIKKVIRYVNQIRRNNFTVLEFAKFISYPVVDTRRYLNQILVPYGFLYIDESSDRVIVNDKLYNYEQANIRKINKIGGQDYDVINIKSICNTSFSNKFNSMIINASLNLDSKKLIINGVRYIPLSAVQYTSLHPIDKKVIIGENRNMNFDGKVFVGRRLQIEGTDFSFDYDNFMIDLGNINFLSLKVPSPEDSVRDNYGDEELFEINTLIQSSSGELYIDHPNNKSGDKNHSSSLYPIFKTMEYSYVYYNHIMNGVYKRQNFFFEIDTFVIKEIRSFDFFDVKFPGRFSSAGIFSEFYDTLRVRVEDYSLGLEKSDTISGFDLYGGNAHYYGKIDLSNFGLIGNGKLEYENSVSLSDNIYLFPDSSWLLSAEFFMNEVSQGIEFPSVNNSDIFGFYYPYQYQYKLFNNIQRKDLKFNGNDFSFYNNQSIFDGDLILRPEGLEGNGLMSFDEFRISSPYFKYNAQWFKADNSDLNANSFKANNFNTRIYLDDRKGEFRSQNNNGEVELLDRRYTCFINEFYWDMDNYETLSLGGQTDSSQILRFLSQDSLSFLAKKAVYNYKSNIIDVYDPDKILLADITVIPKNNIRIMENAKIAPLRESTILVRTDSTSHEFIDANIEIHGNHEYNATGYYKYLSPFISTQTIYFNNISLNQDSMTEASGDAKLDLSDKFSFDGSVKMFANYQHLQFDGKIYPKYECGFDNTGSYSFNNLFIDPSRIKIPISESNQSSTRSTTTEITSGVFMSKNANFYTTFLTPPKSIHVDSEIINILDIENKDSVYLFYDTISSCFVLESPSSSFLLNDTSCTSVSRGVVDLSLNLQELDVNSLGSVIRDEKNDITQMQLFIMFDFLFSDDALLVFAKDVYESVDMLDLTEDYYNNLEIVVKDENDRDLMDEKEKVPKALKRKEIIFPDISLLWVEKEKSYVSQGGKIPIGNILDKQLNVFVDGIVKLNPLTNSFIFYFRTFDRIDYFFEYKEDGNKGKMFAWSSNDEFNQYLRETKMKRRIKRSKGDILYQYEYLEEGQFRANEMEKDLKKY